ncbi:MAG: hypothetical protein AB1756_07280 [Acidobacteriota bacterium]
MEEEKLEVEIKDEDRVMLVFSYLGPLSIVSILTARKEFIKWHAKQGFIFFILWMALFVVLQPFYLFFKLIWLGWLFLTIEILIGLGIFALAFFCMVRGLEGEKFKIPFIGDLADRF